MSYPPSSSPQPPFGSPYSPPPLPMGGQVMAYAPRVPMRRFSAGEIVAWGVIVCLVGLIAVLAARTQSKEAASTGPDSSLKMEAQYSLGVHQFAAGNQKGEQARTDDDALTSLDKNAKAPEDKLRVAIFAGETKGDEEALRRLAQVEENSPELQGDVETARGFYGKVERPAEVPAEFQQKYGWFAELMESHGKANDDPQRKAVLARATYAFGMSIGTLGMVCVAGVAGLVVLIIAIVLLARGRLKLAFQRDNPPGQRLDRRTYIFSMAVYLGGYVALGLSLRVIFSLLRVHNDVLGLIASVGSLLMATLAGLLLPRMLGQTWAQWREALGLHTGKGVLREMAGGVVGYLAGLPLLGVGMVLFMFLSRISGLKGSHPINDELGGSTFDLMVAFFTACVFAPITEELMFRGALFAHLRERFPWWLSAVTMGVIFALMHPQSWVALPVLASIGITFGAIREWRGSIIGSMTAHALHNGGALLVTVLLMR